MTVCLLTQLLTVQLLARPYSFLSVLLWNHRSQFQLVLAIRIVWTGWPTKTCD